MTAAPRAALGAALLIAHAAAFAGLLARCQRPALAVAVRGAPVAATPSLTGEVDPALADRLAIARAGDGPGLHRTRWAVRYRGGVERAVTAAQLVGPFQDPAAPPCAGRLVIGQRLLDDGRAGPGTLAAALTRELTAALAGAPVFALGAFERADAVALRWATLAAHPDDAALVGDAPHGYLRAAATLVFARVRVPIVLAAILTPSVRPGADALGLRVAARAGVAFDSAVATWLADKLGADRLITRLAARQLDRVLVQALGPPPPLAVPGGPPIQLAYCAEPPEIVDGDRGELPFAIAFADDPRHPGVRPPRRGPGPRPAPPPTAALALELELDALNALLYELWRAGALDRALARAGLDRAFNADPTVAALLSVRLGAVTLALPPVVRAAPGGLALAADARLALTDAGQPTLGRAWGELAFRFPPRLADPVAVDLAALELSCERPGGVLVPCYADLLGAVRDRAPAFHDALTRAFATLLPELAIGRFAAAGVPLELAIRAAVPQITVSGSHATLRVALDGAVLPAHAAP